MLLTEYGIRTTDDEISDTHYKMKRTAIFLVVFLLLCFLSSPYLSLVCSERLRDHTYREILMHVVAVRKTRGINSPLERARKLFYFCFKNNIQNPGDLAPYDDKALGYLINGAVYCDYVADILAVLCAHSQMPARYCMLMDKDGVSPHTVTEALIDKKWRIFDAADGYYYTLGNGELAALEDLSRNPDLIFQSKRLLKIKEKDPSAYSAKCAWYANIFPVPHAPQRSKSKTKRITIFDRVGILYYDIFGMKFLRPYQDAYLSLKTRDMEPVEALYYLARNYQLTGRLDEAIVLYNEFLRSFAGLKGREKALIFLSFIYMDELGDLGKAIVTLSPLAVDPRNIYAKYALYYTGACYQALGDSVKAQEYFDNSGIAVYLDPELAN